MTQDPVVMEIITYMGSVVRICFYVNDTSKTFTLLTSGLTNSLIESQCVDHLSPWTLV